MRTFYGAVIVLILFVLVLGLAWIVTTHRSARARNLTGKADSLEMQATGLRNQAARIRAIPSPLDADAREAQAQELDGRAAELLNEATFLQRTGPVAAGLIAAEYLRRAQAMSDSAAKIRDDLLARQGSITDLQEGLLVKLEQDAHELQSRAQLFSSQGSQTRDQVDLYNACVLTYGDATHTCNQLRGAGTTGAP